MTLELPDTRPPLPPLDMIDRVTRPFSAADADYVREGFDTYPRLQLRALERALALVGKEFADFGRLLDFGCGPGRFLRHLGPLAATTEVHGADVDADAIEWLQANVPYAHHAVIPPSPPTSYRDGWFDLVVAHSVFTHLGPDAQDRWLGELQRITASGAILLITVHGLGEWRRTLTDMRNGGEDDTAWRAQYGRDGIVHIRDDHFIGSAHADGYHTTFHAPWYVLDHWSRWFDIVAYVPEGVDVQDLVVLRRRDGASADPPATDSVPERAPAADPLVDAVDALAGRLAGGGDRSTARRLRDRVLGRDERDEIDAEIVVVLREVVAALRARDRELTMVRVGMYEQGRRTSLLARQLRDDVAAASSARREDAD